MTWKWLQFSLFVHIFVAQASAYLRCNLNLLLGSSINCQLEREQGSAGTRTALNPRVTRRLGVGHAVGGRYVARGRRRIPGALCMVELYRNDAEADFYANRLRDLITVYAMKTAYHYWLELRGNMYAEWLARFIEEQGGVDSLGWEPFLSGMLRAPPEDIVVKKLIKSPRGGSGSNPYLKDRKPVTYTETIEPVSIARRIMEIREQVADMLSSDLKQMAAENAKLQLDYAAESEFGPARAEVMKLSNWEPMTEVDPSSGYANPPQRRSTYRSALELVTSASIRRVKSELRIRGDKYTLDWLERFSEVELEERGNKLIQALFDGPMVLINDKDRAKPKFIEPLKVAKTIMQGRELVAEELIAVLSEVPRDHNQLTVSLLNEKWHAVGDVETGTPDPSET